MTNKELEHLSDDQLVEVQLTRKDYKILKHILEERQAMSGLKQWIHTRIFWFAGGLLTVLGLFEYVRRFSE